MKQGNPADNIFEKYPYVSKENSAKMLKDLWENQSLLKK